MYYRVPEDNKWYNLDPEKLESIELPPTEEQESDTDSSSEDLDDSVTSLESGTSGGSHW